MHVKNITDIQCIRDHLMQKIYQHWLSITTKWSAQYSLKAGVISRFVRGFGQAGLDKQLNVHCIYRPIHSVKFSASSGNQLEYNGSQGANGSH